MEEITANLTLLPTVQVIPGKNALGHDGAVEPLSEIGKKLRIDFVLQGKVLWLGRQMRVIPQLIRVADETIVWTAPLAGSTHNPFTAQQEIS